jgi:hypothetical protein
MSASPSRVIAKTQEEERAEDLVDLPEDFPKD